jgi:hypothetical protein
VRAIAVHGMPAHLFIVVRAIAVLWMSFIIGIIYLVGGRMFREE